MGKAAALLAAALLTAALGSCGGGGAEPGAPQGVTLVLDFQPNAVHAGIYTALARGLYEDAGIDLDVREPSASSDAPKLLESDRAQFAILDIHDLGLARERGFDVVGVAPIVQRPLAAVIAADRDAVRRPADLVADRVGVTGLPSDDAVLDSVLEADGVDPGSVDRVTIGFDAVAALAGGQVDAATAFWNAEGVALRRRGVPTREFRVDRYGAPRYPELVLVTTRALIDDDPGLVEAVVGATMEGYRLAVTDPEAALDDLLAGAEGLDRSEQQAQLEGLEPALSPVGRLDPAVLRAWSRWDAEHGILEQPVDVGAAFDTSFVD
jgi:NitT/TauT family transport system substrate-binding protein/putative hydroxymethylpyrimidine transport system substrate-binding protein